MPANCLLTLPRCFAIALLWAAVSLTFAQDTSGPVPAEPVDQEIRVVLLKFAQAPLVANTITSVYANQADQISVVSDERCNTLILRTPKKFNAEIMELIETLDREETARWQVKTFQLKNTAVAPAVLDTLTSVIDPATRISFDKTRNIIIASGPPNSLQVIEAVLLRLDSEKPLSPAPAQDVQVRVVWLVSGDEAGQGGDPPKDLDNVVTELKRFGIDNLRLAAQVLVSAVEGEKFQASGLTEFFATGPSQLEIAGLLAAPSQRGGALQLQLSVRANQVNGSPQCELETSIKAPLGQSVVLGATPVHSQQSAFVVQLVGRNSAGGE